jgi:hypothetical protein
VGAPPPRDGRALATDAALLAKVAEIAEGEFPGATNVYRVPGLG